MQRTFLTFTISKCNSTKLISEWLFCSSVRSFFGFVSCDWWTPCSRCDTNTVTSPDSTVPHCNRSQY